MPKIKENEIKPVKNSIKISDKETKINITRSAKFNMQNYESQDIMVSLTTTIDSSDSKDIQDELERVRNLVEAELAEIMEDNELEFASHRNTRYDNE